MYSKLKLWLWVLVLVACARIVVSLLSYGYQWSIYIEMHLMFIAPYALLAVAVAAIRSARMARWAFGVLLVQIAVTFITCYEAPREFWRYLGLWINYIFIGQTAIAGLFLFESLRQFRREMSCEKRVT
jgi:hypothetical protein